MIAPGFSPYQVAYAIPFIRILFPLLFFISSGALLGGALQSVHHFFAPAFGPALHNIVYIGTLSICLLYEQSVTFLALGVLLGGVCAFLLHLFFFLKHHFRFGVITTQSIAAFNDVIKKFLPCLFGVGVVEVNMFLDRAIASFLPKGSVTLLYYGNRFMQLPLGIFAVGLSSVLLPHFSRITLYAPKRLYFYLLEVTKFITWVIVPTTLFIMFCAEKIFTHMFAHRVTPAQITEARWILILYSSALVFYCLNKVLVNIFYSMGDTWRPTLASIIATLSNLVFNLIGMYFFGSLGIAAATALSGVILTVVCLYYLRSAHKFRFYSGNYATFILKYTPQLIVASALFYGTHRAICSLLAHTTWHSFFCIHWGYWLFTIPLFLFTLLFLFYTKKYSKISLYFLQK